MQKARSIFERAFCFLSIPKLLLTNKVRRYIILYIAGRNYQPQNKVETGDRTMEKLDNFSRIIAKINAPAFFAEVEGIEIQVFKTPYFAKEKFLIAKIDGAEFSQIKPFGDFWTFSQNTERKFKCPAAAARAALVHFLNN
jgi:hypothetical protein